MSTKSRRQQILERSAARCRGIQIADGYQTDAGDHVLIGESPELSEHDPDTVIVVAAGDEEPHAMQGDALLVKLPILIYVAAKANLEAPYLTVEALIADVKRAMERADRTLGINDDPTLGPLVPYTIERARVQTLPREAGSTTVGAVVPYIAPYKEVWGWP